jgi:hypothetical protein
LRAAPRRPGFAAWDEERLAWRDLSLTCCRPIWQTVRGLLGRVLVVAVVTALSAALVSPVGAHAAAPAGVHRRAHPPIRSAPPPVGPRRAQPAVPQPVGHIPCDVYNAYHATPTAAVDDGTGKTIAVIDPYGTPTIAADFTAFSSAFSLGPQPLTVVQADPRGFDTSAPDLPDWSLEVPLDVEWAHALSPGAQVVLVVAYSSYDVDMVAAVDYAVTAVKADVVTMSWGFDESDYPDPSAEPSNSHFPPTNGAGRPVVFLAATGDQGPTPVWPAVSPNVVAVGGTSVTPAAFGGQDVSSHTTCPTAGPFGVNNVNETTWDGTGGGTSIYQPKPSYQASLPETMRATPDIAMLADPNDGVAVYQGGSWESQVLGGTSLPTPMWAGLVARLDQVSGRSVSGVGWLYAAAQVPLPSTYLGFNDVIAGSSTYTPPAPSPPTTIAAGPGYDEVTGLGSPLWNVSTSYFTWFDQVSDVGFRTGHDNIHVVNPNTTNTVATINIPGQPSCSSGSVVINPSKEFVYTCPSGFGGPVTVTSSQRIVASQRVQYNQTFNEEKSLPAASATRSIVFTWYDNASDSGFANGIDNVHVVNPGSVAAKVDVAIGAHELTPKTIQPGKEDYFNYPGGYGGPVIVTADQPVLASQRVKYYASFNEVPGMPAGGGDTSLWFPWFDRVSDPGFSIDNVHVFAPAATTVTVNIPPCGDLPAMPILAGQSEAFTCAKGFMGPVHVTSTGGVKVVATQRVKYYQTFNEVPAQSKADAANQLWLAWYDQASAGFTTDDVHVVNPGPGDLMQVQIQIPGCDLPAFPLRAGNETYRNCPDGIGGPVKVTADGPVLASGRVKFYGSFNEVTASP